MNWTGRWTMRQLAGVREHGELRVLVLALTIAVAAASAVQLFSDRVGRAINLQSADTLGADRIFSSREPLPAEFLAQIDILASERSETTHLPSVVWHDERSHLAGVKAVAAGYPLRGSLRIADAPYATDRLTSEIPAPGEAWVDVQLWTELQLAPGARIELGATSLTVTALLSYEPDRGSGFVDIAPRLLINELDLLAAQLLAPGSRAQYRHLVTASESRLAALDELELPRGISAISPADARPEVRSAVQRAQAFLALAAMSASLLGAAAIALCAHQYAGRLAPDVALLRCLGAGRAAIVRTLLLSLLAIGLLAGGGGLLIGLAAQWLLAALADSLLLQSLPPLRAGPALQSLVIGLVLLAGFALPPLLAATQTAPVRVFQSGAQSRAGGRLWTLLALVAVVFSLWLQSRDWQLIATVAGGQVATAVVLALLVWLLLRALDPLRGRSLAGWRLGLGNLLRRPALTLAQSSALGLGLLALLLLTVVRADLLSSWQQKLPADTPNQFLINIQAEQLDPLRAFFAQHDLAPQRIWPMARARLVSLNGASVNADDFADPDTQRWINRDFNLSWTAELGTDNLITDGQWWGEAGTGKAYISADSYAQERLDLKLGDVLGLTIAGETFELAVTNFREVDWESFQPNFFLLTPPGVLDQAPATWLTSFFLPERKQALRRELSRQFPNVTILDLGAMMTQVRQIIDRIVAALEFVFIFTIAAGLSVLLAAMEVGREQRQREIALMRTLGASRARIRSALLTEFAVLGGLSGFVAALAAQVCGWLLATQVFEFAYRWNWPALGWGSIGGGALVAGLAWLSLRGVLQTPPRQVLR